MSQQTLSPMKSSMKGSRKQSFTVVKTLESSPKRKIFVSRPPDDADDMNTLTRSDLGNTSPKKPERQKDGTLMPRSILGYPEVFEKVEADIARSNQTSPPRGQRGSGGIPQKSLPKHADNRKASVMEIAENPDAYITTLQDLKTRMLGERKKSIQRRSTLATFLPMVERLGLNKEAKILAKWKQRQAEWEEIIMDISERLNAPKQHALLMQKTDEYRARAEEYAFIRATRPAADLRAEEGWFEWSLRGNTTRSVSVGHAFSGLYCEVSDHAKPPTIMRKPKTLEELIARTNAQAGKVVFVEESKSLKMKKEEYADQLKAMRPVDVSLEDASGLIVKSAELFQWAIDSSTDYFRSEKLKNDALENERAVREVRRSKLSFLRKGGNKLGVDGDISRTASQTASLVGTPRDDPSNEKGGRILFMSPEELIFSSAQGETVYKTVTFKNMGSVALRYQWKILIDLEKSFPKNVSHVASMVANNTLVKLPREHHLAAGRSSIFCMKTHGIILPNETTETRFAFCSKGAAGVLVELWELETIPRANVALDPALSVTQNGAGLGRPDTSNGGPAEYNLITPLAMRVCGHTMEVDLSTNSRNHCAKNIQQQVMTAVIADKDQLHRRRIRAPITLQNMQARKISLFETINKDWLLSLRGTFTTSLPLFVTIERVELFSEMCERAIVASAEAHEALSALRKTARMTFLNATDEELIQLNAIDVPPQPTNINKSSSRIKEMKRILFPERRLESFDVVTMEDIVPSWDYDVSKLLTVIDAYVGTTYEIMKLEVLIADQRAKEEKARAKESRRQERLKLLEPGDEDEEEEEEEEPEIDEEEEERNKPPPPKHPAIAISEAFRSECVGTLQALVTRQLPMDEVHSLARDLLMDVLDRFEEFHDVAMTVLKDNEIATLGPADPAAPRSELVLPVLPSAFTPEGIVVWKKILLAKAIAAEEAAVPKSKSPPKKGGKPGDGPSAEDIEKEKEFQAAQVNLLYKTMYDQVTSALTQAAEGMFSTVESSWTNSTNQRIQTNSNSGTQLFDIAVLRDEDLSTMDAISSPKIVFINFAGEPFAQGCQHGAPSYTSEGSFAARSAFDWVKLGREKSLEPVILAARSGAMAIVLVYESLVSRTLPYLPYASNTIADLLDQDTQAMRVASLKYRPKRKGVVMPCPSVITYRVHACATIAELNYKLERLKPSEIVIGGDTGASPYAEISVVTVFVLEDLREVTVVPPEPLLPPLVITDEEAPLPLGDDENDVKRQQIWDLRRPHRVSAFSVPKEQSVKGAEVVLLGFTDVAAALCESLLIAAGRGGMIRGSPFDGHESTTTNHGTTTAMSSLQQLSIDIQNTLADEASLRSSIDFSYQQVQPVSTNEWGNVLWVESAPQNIFLSHEQGALRNFNTGTKLPYLFGHSGSTSRCSPISRRLVSKDVREACLWMGVVQLLPQAGSLLAEVEQAKEAEALAIERGKEEENEWLQLEAADLAAAEAGGGEDRVLLPPRPSAPTWNTASPSAIHFTRLFTSFTNFHAPSEGPRLTVVLGGEIRSDKFRILDELIGIAHTIVLTGELALPFIALNQRIMLIEYRTLCAPYQVVCAQLCLKARAHGCQLVLPQDLLTGDLPISSALKQRCYEIIDKDSRDDAPDYEGETKVMVIGTKEKEPVVVAPVAADHPVEDPKGKKPPKGKNARSSFEAAPVVPVVVEVEVTPPSSTEMIYVRGYVVDIGPASIQMLKEEVAKADVVLVWGTVGMCEVGPFQVGQRALISAASKKKPGPDGGPLEKVTDTGARAPLYTLLIGDSTVEWFARVLDADGEVEGDIVAAGRVAYSARQSSLPVGLLGACQSHVLDGGLISSRSARPTALPDFTAPISNGTNTITPIQIKHLYKMTMANNEWVYNWKRIGEEEDEEEEDDEEDED